MSSKTLFIGGYGPGISNAIAERFGREGFSVALVGRTKDRLAAGVRALKDKGITATAFVADLGDAAAVRKTIADVRASLGPIDVLSWVAASYGAGDLLTVKPEELQVNWNLSITSVLCAVQASLADLRERKGAVLLTNGGLGLFDDTIDGHGVNLAGLSITNSAKHKLSRLLAKRLGAEGIFVGEVMVGGAVNGTSFDRGNATIAAETVAARFWELHQARQEHFALVR